MSEVLDMVNEWSTNIRYLVQYKDNSSWMLFLSVERDLKFDIFLCLPVGTWEIEMDTTDDVLIYIVYCQSLDDDLYS